MDMDNEQPEKETDNMIEFHLPITPPKCTSQTKRLMIIKGKPMFFPKKEHLAAENDMLTLCARHAPEKPLQGPIALRVTFVFPWRKSESKKSLALGMVPNDTRPDLDNMVKMIGDVLTKLRFYNDDGQVADLHVRKFWGDQVGISLRVGEILNEGELPL